MKLSEFKGDKALDVLADLIDPVSVIFTDQKFVDDYRSGKPKLLLAKYLLKEHKSSIISVLSILDDKTEEEYKKTCNPIKIIAEVLEIMNDKDILPFLSLQGQKMEETQSGSVLESTKASKK